MSIDDLLSLALTHKWLAVSAVLVGALVRAVKGDTPLPFVPAKYRPWLALGLGVLAAGLDKLVNGGTLSQAIVEGVVIGGLPIVGHELGIESVRGGKEIKMPNITASLLPFLLILCLAGCGVLKSANDARLWLCDHIGETHAAEISAQAAKQGVSPAEILTAWRLTCLIRMKQAEGAAIGAIGSTRP